jgi:GrpB-like predicted nucleotidyltransferase (UPF0157 family)
MAEPVVIVDYDPGWAELFDALRSRMFSLLGDLAAGVEHVGSTAVPGLAAKPIIDLDVLLRSEADMPAVIERLAGAGYVHQGDLGVPGREAFATPPQSIPHHLYVCPPGSPEYRRHLAFRNYLRSHSAEAAAYGGLKRELAMQFRDDRAAYTDGKSAFVAEILRRAIGSPN